MQPIRCGKNRKVAGAPQEGIAMEHFSKLDMYYLGQGTHYDIYKKLGAHPVTEKGEKGVNFAVWAPNAKKVFVKEDGQEILPGITTLQTPALFHSPH